MASVKVNEIALIGYQSITSDDSMIVLDAATRTTLRLTLEQFSLYLEGVLLENVVLTQAKGPEGFI